MIEVDQNLEDIVVVREYPDVFPEDILEFPPEKEIKFTIELVPDETNIHSSVLDVTPRVSRTQKAY